MVLSMDRWIGKAAIVTGASAGIGAAIATKLVEEGMKVLALARRKDLLDELAVKLQGKKGRLYPFKADVAEESDIIAAFRYALENIGPVHVLVNNAAVCRMNSLSCGKTEDWLEQYKVNVIGLCTATREAVRLMKGNGVQGHIININSIAGHRVYNTKDSNVYASTKFAVTALTDSWRYELVDHDSDIKITSISPGVVETDMLREFLFNGEDTSENEDYSKLPKLSPEDLADSVVYVLSTPPHVQIQELTIKPVGEKF